eukprot:PITA_03882
MNEEISAIEKSKTWELVDLLECKDAIGVKWVYKTKSNAEGKIDRHKAILVVKGYKQQQGKDYDETFAPVTRMETVRTVLSIAAQHKWKIYQMDVKSAFLIGVLKEEAYVEQPPGYEVEGQEHKVCKLQKALYGLKQAPRAWYNRIDAYLIENGYDKCDGEPTLYIKENDDKILIVVLYVDDLVFTSNDSSLITDFKAVMKSEFEMNDLGFLRYFLGIEVDQSENSVFISQVKYVEAVFKRFNMLNSKAAVTPTVMGLKLTKEDSSKDFDPKLYKSIVGSLMYFTAIRPDIMHAHYSGENQLADILTKPLGMKSFDHFRKCLDRPFLTLSHSRDKVLRCDPAAHLLIRRSIFVPVKCMSPPYCIDGFCLFVFPRKKVGFAP